MFPNVYAALKAAPAVTAIIGATPRAYRHGSAPQTPVKPYVTFSFPAGDAEINFDAPDADTFRLNLDCWSDNDPGIETLAAAVRAAIEPHAYLIAYTADDRDFGTQTYRIGMAFDWISPRA